MKKHNDNKKAKIFLQQWRSQQFGNSQKALIRKKNPNAKLERVFCDQPSLLSD